jgi:uncharacterized alpha/beta hydrolase family protein
MAQFSVKIMRLTGSVLGENQHDGTVALQSATYTGSFAGSPGRGVRI